MTQIPDPAELRRRFFEAHETAYGYHSPDDPIEAVNLRLTARITPPRRDSSAGAAGAAGTARRAEPTERRQVHFEAAAAHHTPVYRRDHLAPGQVLDGPLVIEQVDATTLVHPGDRATVDAARNLIIELAR